MDKFQLEKDKMSREKRTLVLTHFPRFLSLLEEEIYSTKSPIWDVDFTQAPPSHVNDDEVEENESRAKKRKRNQSKSNCDDTSITEDTDFESYINGLKEKKLPKEFFVKIMKDLTTNDLKKTEKLNSILLKEWMQSIEENHQLKAENERLEKLNKAMDVSQDHMFEHENIEIKQEEEENYF